MSRDAVAVGSDGGTRMAGARFLRYANTCKCVEPPSSAWHSWWKWPLRAGCRWPVRTIGRLIPRGRPNWPSASGSWRIGKPVRIASSLSTWPGNRGRMIDRPSYRSPVCLVFIDCGWPVRSLQGGVSELRIRSLSHLRTSSARWRWQVPAGVEDSPRDSERGCRLENPSVNRFPSGTAQAIKDLDRRQYVAEDVELLAFRPLQSPMPIGLWRIAT